MPRISWPVGTDLAPNRASLIEISKKFRPEIEGVRFVAALLVASYHIWSGRVSGGVDVFFVMSGFLITTTLIGQLNAYGLIRPLAFLTRLAFRLLPAALTTLTTVLVASWLFLPELLWDRIGLEVRAAALYAENWYLAATSTDYLGQFEEKTPVQHFWALSLQGQFYVAWLLLFLVLARVIRRRPQHAVRIVAGGLGVVLVSSLAFSVWYTAVNQPVAYFSTPARGWEFALGGLAALALRRPPTSRSRLRWFLGWVGLGVLLSTGLVLQVSTVFPGYAALVPTGAALMILLSSRNGLRGGADALLGSRPLVFLGGISYGLYLWHFPLLVFYRHLRATESNGIASGVAIIVTAIVLAWLTQRLVERPLLAFSRRSPVARRDAVTGLLVVVVAVAVTASSFSADRVDSASLAETERLAATLGRTAYDLEPCTGALAREPGSVETCAERRITQLRPEVDLVEATQVPLPCDLVHRDGYLKVCAGGAPAASAKATAILIGDSHSVTMRPALDLVARHNNWELLFAYSPGCQTASTPKSGDTADRCATWMRLLTAYIQDHAEGIDVLFDIQAAAADLVGVPQDDPTDASVAAYRAQWDRYAGAVEQLVVIRDTPRLSDTLLSCIARFDVEEAAEACSRRRSTALKTDYAALAAATDDDPSTQTVDLSDIFCDENRCYPIIGGFIAYRDAVHLHTLFAPTLTTLLDEAIRTAVTPQVRKQLFSTG